MNSFRTDQFICDHRASAHLASITAACIASSICWPAAACSSGMGTANNRPLLRPSESVLAAKQHVRL